MATSNPSKWSRRRIILAAAFAIGFGATIFLLGTPTASAGTTADLGGLEVDGVNKTVDGNVSDVTLNTSMNYEYDVPDATQRVIKLKVGPNEGDLETIDYVVEQDPSGSVSGSVSLSGSVLEHAELSASDVNPALASSEETEFVVEVSMEVTRANGEVVTREVSDTVVVRLRDGASLEASLGGSGSVTVETTG